MTKINIERGRLVHLLKEKISDPVLVQLLKLWLNNPRQLNREPEMPSQPAPHKPGLAPTPTSELTPSQPEGNLVDRLAEFTRLALEGGLDWGISALSSGQAGSNSGYYRASAGFGTKRETSGARPRGNAPKGIPGRKP
ncbi:MAG: hypothetical protein HXX08_17140 [Chloroflexi bacterium]|uniref:Uncharacterized protein n=1 Tax=Candidatus Chlorohelix allophototropha TaxID=3003348 RepID=A0A8T7M661_9CHLR|nr:hypothetical protein [Chloroflexota bacterium]WJW69494.1 hypothetical protein OZ401_003111 [Chloroflexota bacterium L227-S17]